MNRCDPSVRQFAIVAASVLLALYLGVLVGNGNFIGLLLFAMTVGAVLWITTLFEYTWQVGLIVSFTGFFYKPLGFSIGPIELSCGLAVLFIIANGWRKQHWKRVGALTQPSFSVLRLALRLLVIYILIHAFYNIRNPLKPADFAIKNAVKVYLLVVGPAALLLYFSAKPIVIRTGRTLRTVALLLLIGVVVNTLVTLYRLWTHHNVVDPDADWRTMTFLIPRINVIENFYTLRSLGPIAVLFGTTTLSLRRPANRISRSLSFVLILAGLFGSLVSGGRATIATVGVFVFAVLLLTKRIRAIVIMLLIAAVFLVVVNIFSEWINREAPPPVLRALQWAMLTKNGIMYGSIESSSQWREEVFERAVMEWRSNPRTFWFGRATYEYGIGDYVANQVSGGWEASQISALRRGATHNIFTDCLIVYGLFGCVLYFFFALSLIVFAWAVYRRPDTPMLAKPLALICFIASLEHLLYSCIGGEYFPIEQTWLFIILIALLYRNTPDNISTQRVHATAFELPVADYAAR